jgi:Peroxisomal biogenesis factor 11 (PEX11)
MGVWTVPWEEQVMRQANTYWFYAICFSLAGTLYSIFFSAPAKSANKPKNDKEKNKEEPAGKTPKTSALLIQFVADSCDLLLPVELLDWYPTGDLVLGVTMVVSTVLTGWNIWTRV